MIEEQALKAVTDLLGAKAVTDHITGRKTNQQVRIACILAVDNGGTLSTADVATILALNETPDQLPA